MNRRKFGTFLLGATGVALGLPALHSLRRFGGHAVAAPVTGLPNLIVFFNCNGMWMDDYWPSQTGALSAGNLAPSMAPLAPHVNELLVLGGLHMAPRGFGRDGGGGDDHQKGMAHKLTAQLIGGDGWAQGISIDQRASQELTGSPALTLAVGRRSNSVTGRISYSGPGTPVAPENNPWLVYSDLIGNGAPLSKEAVARLMARRESVLDLCGEEYEELLRQDLSQADKDKLDMHFTTVRDLEVNLGQGCSLPPERIEEISNVTNQQADSNAEFQRMGRMMIDIMALAISCGKTRVSTLQWGSGAGGPIYDWIPEMAAYNHHKLSHGDTTDADDNVDITEVSGYEQMLQNIDNWHAGEFAYLLDKLKGYSGSDGTLLDDSCVMWANEMSHGRYHSFMDLPYILAGSCCGYLKTGEYIRFVEGSNDQIAPHNKLLTTILNGMGVSENHFGDTNFGKPGEYEEIKA